MGIIKYFAKVSWEIYETEGARYLAREILRYLTSSNSLKKLIPYWSNRIRRKNWIAKDIQGFGMWLNYQHDGQSADLIMNGIRERQVTKHLQNILQPRWAVVDIGANIGYYALMEAKKCKEVYAIEPGPDCYQALRANVVLNNYHNVTTHRLAIGDRERVARLSLSDFSEWHKIALDSKGGIEVQMTTLDSFLKGKKVDLVRMDVEGYEFNILKGMQKTIEKSNPILLVETHKKLLEEYGSSLQQFYELLASYNYILTYSIVQGELGLTGYMRDLLNNKELYQGQNSWLFLEKGK